MGFIALGFEVGDLLAVAGELLLDVGVLSLVVGGGDFVLAGGSLCGGELLGDRAGPNAQGRDLLACGFGGVALVGDGLFELGDGVLALVGIGFDLRVFDAVGIAFFEGVFELGVDLLGFFD